MSMTREEAITNLEKLAALFHTESEQSKMVDYSKIIETLEFAAAALRPITREQVEKAWRGEWELVRRMAAAQEFRCSVCGANNTYYGHPEKFCADCGSAMTDKAVDMVMERLEALYEET